MLLESHELELFFKLHRALMFFVNERLKVIPDKIATPEALAALAPQLRLKVRDAFLENLDLLDLFAEVNPAHLSQDELEIVRSWQHLVHGTFYVTWPRPRPASAHAAHAASTRRSCCHHRPLVATGARASIHLSMSGTPRSCRCSRARRS